MIKGLHRLTFEVMMITFDICTAIALVGISIDMFRDVKKSLKEKNNE